ncbi:hypothetical protein NDGK_01558 [Clostridiales bacterium CHKCI001]|nr:hypothetical protein NDGK_01558 [Clostridiales bacterium CHKCI001]
MGVVSKIGITIWNIFILFLLGTMMLVKPELLWKIEHIFTVKNGEPTELYMTLMRIGGVFFVSVAVIMTVVLLLQ